MDNSKSENAQPKASKEDGVRVYRTDDLIVYWDAKLCSHAGKCWQGLPQVFKPKERPWVTMAAATPEEIIKTIDTCPTDALKYQLPEGSKVDPVLAKGPGAVDFKREHLPTVKIKMVKNGPLVVEGTAQIYDPAGNLLKESSRVVLCSCGRSKNAPFCDGTHLHKE